MLREPTDAELSKIVLALHDLPTVDAIDKLREVLQDIRDCAVEAAVVVLLGKGLDLGFNPPHLGCIAAVVKQLKWGPRNG